MVQASVRLCLVNLAAKSAWAVVSRSGNIQSVAGASCSRMMYRSAATMVVVSGFAQVLVRVLDAAVLGQVVETGHFLRLPLRRVREYEALMAFRLGRW